MSVVQTVEEFLEQAGFYRKLEREIFERDIYSAIRDAGFDPVRLKQVGDLGLTAVTAKSDISREARFEDGPITRILYELHKRGLDAEEDRVDLSHQGQTLTLIVGVREPPRRQTAMQASAKARI